MTHFVSVCVFPSAIYPFTIVKARIFTLTDWLNDLCDWVTGKAMDIATHILWQKLKTKAQKKIYFYKDNKGIYLSHFSAFWLFESKERSLHSFFFFFRGNSVEFNCWMS